MSNSSQNSRDDQIWVFIPGIMGSTLISNGPDSHGQIVRKEVWSTSLSINLSLLATNPSALRSENVISGEVIERFTGLTKINLYKEIINFCCSADGLGLTKEKDFFLFHYDWRQDNVLTADLLANFIRSKDPSGTKNIYIVAHSMGGIVARLMLNANHDISKLTKLFYQIASPIQGSAKAYKTLQMLPEFDRIFDLFWKLHHNIKPERRYELLTAIQSFQSIYQLLPHDDVVTLFDTLGQQYSATNKALWPRQIFTMLDSANEVHKKLQIPLPNKIVCIYSGTIETPHAYLIDSETKEILAENYKVCGDGTVACASAYAFTGGSCRYHVNIAPLSHDRFCEHADVLSLIKDRAND